MFNQNYQNMPLLKDDAPIFVQTIKQNLRHQDYDHVKKIAKNYTIYATGADIECKLRKVFGRETEEQFAQRKVLTICNVADLVNATVKPLNKVTKTPANKAITWQGKDAKQTAENLKKLEDIADKFWGERSVENYLEKRMVQFDKTDPNTFIVCEFKGQTTPDNPTEIYPYPFEVNSCEAINYFFKNEILQWLIVLNYITIVDDKGTLTNGEIYYAYLENQTLRATEIHKTLVQAWKNANPNYILIDANFQYETLTQGQVYLLPQGKDDNNGRYFIFEVINHNMGMVPAFRVGNNMDAETNYRTCVPVIEPAKSYFEDSIQTMSEFGTTKRLHTFPQKFTYLPKCPGEPHKNKHCNKGFTADGKVCKLCDGTGVVSHTSSQDIIGIQMPDDLKDIINLDFISTYKGPPLDLVKFQKEYGFDDLKRYAIGAVYNSGTFGHTQIVKTATENEIDLESVYDTIKDFADNYSAAYCFFMKCIAILNNLQEGIDIVHKFPNDFAMEPLDYLLTSLKQANESGAPSYVRKALNNKIARKVWIDQPREVLKIETKEKYFPFHGKTESEIALVISNELTTKFYKVLYANFDTIIDDLEYEFSLQQIDFYQLTETLQRSAIEAKVNTLLDEIETQDAASAANGLGLDATSGQQTPDSIEQDAKAQLRGSVDGINAIIAIQNSVAAGKSTPESAIAMLINIFGFDDITARNLLGQPKPDTQPAQPIFN